MNLVRMFSQHGRNVLWNRKTPKNAGKSEPDWTEAQNLGIGGLLFCQYTLYMRH